MFRTAPLSIIRTFSLYTQQWYRSYRFCWQLASCQSMTYNIAKMSAERVWHIPSLCVQWKTPDDGQRNCPKRVEFYSKNKFCEISASSWFFYMYISRCTVSWTSKLTLCFVLVQDIELSTLWQQYVQKCKRETWLGQMKHQLDATLCRFYFWRITLHVSDASAHHQEYLKLVRRPLVHVFCKIYNILTLTC